MLIQNHPFDTLKVGDTAELTRLCTEEALLIFAARIGLTRLALLPSAAWSANKKHAIALSLCSLVGFGSLVVDNSMTGAPYMSEAASSVMAALLALNVLLGPGLTWWGLKLAAETYEGDEHG